MAERIVDARRLLCPMPVIRTQDAVADMMPGTRLRVIGTDPGMKLDVPAWCRINGHHVLDILDHGEEIEIRIEVGSGE